MEKFGKEYKEIASKVLDCTLASYYNWSKQERPIIKLLEKYFTKDDLEEFLVSEKINKLEKVDYVYEIVVKKYDKYISKVINDSICSHEILCNNPFNENEPNLIIQEILSSVPIFVFLSYIYESNEIENEPSYDYFAKNILYFITKYTNIGEFFYTNLLSINEDLFEIFEFFRSYKNFEVYYRNISDEYKKIDSEYAVHLHKYYEHLYNELKILKSNQTLNTIEKKENIYKILNLKFIDYQNNLF